MKSLQHASRLVAVLFILALLCGCTKTLHFNTPEMTPQYPVMTKPFPYRAALIVPTETRERAFTIPLRRWNIGEAVPSHMASALKSAFKTVAVADEGKLPADAERGVVCRLGSATDLKLGLLATSDHTATIELTCLVQDGSLRTLWEGTVLHSETFNAGMLGKMHLLTAAASIFFKNADTSGSEELLASVIADGSNTAMVLAVDKLMEKMITEGRSRICPPCNAATDWRTSVHVAPPAEEKDEFDSIGVR